MNFVDIFIIIFIGLFAIFGLYKGLIKIIFSFSKKIVAFVASYFLVGPFRKILLPSKLGLSINSKVFEWILQKNALLANLKDPTPADIEAIAESTNLPKFICDILYKLVEDDIAGKTLGELLSETVTYYIVTALAYIILVIILVIVISILSNVLNSLFETVVLKPFNRILGMCLNAFIAILFISLFFLGLNALAPTVSLISTFVDTYIDPNNPSFGIARFLYNNNILMWIVSDLININDII